MSDLKIWKAIFEVRFPASAALFDNRGKVAAKWQWTSDLSEWMIDAHQVIVHNKANTTYLRAGFKNLVVVMELPANYATFASQALEFSAWTLDTLNIKKVERIGLRLLQVSERRHFKLLVTQMRKRLFCLTDDDWEVIGGPPADMAVPLTLSLGEYTANFSLGPMEKEQLIPYFESKEAIEKLPNVALFLDFDLYKDAQPDKFDISRQILDDHLKSGGERILDLSRRFVDKFGGFE